MPAPLHAWRLQHANKHERTRLVCNLSKEAWAGLLHINARACILVVPEAADEQQCTVVLLAVELYLAADCCNLRIVVLETRAKLVVSKVLCATLLLKLLDALFALSGLPFLQGQHRPASLLPETHSKLPKHTLSLCRKRAHAALSLKPCTLLLLHKAV